MMHIAQTRARDVDVYHTLFCDISQPWVVFDACIESLCTILYGQVHIVYK